MTRASALRGYESLAAVLDEALDQAQAGKGHERHAVRGEAFADQQIVQLGEWMGGSTVFVIGQACKKSIESTRLPPGRARAELLGAINYLAAAVLVIDRRAPADEASTRGATRLRRLAERISSVARRSLTTLLPTRKW